MSMSTHQLNFNKKLTCNMGELVPVGIYEALPGDIIRQKPVALIRTQPLVTPVMHRATCKLHTFFVPARLLWDSWENFITGGQDGLDASVPPTITLSSAPAVGSLADYLGITTGVASQVVNAMPFRAYNMIWNEYYRDKDLQTEAIVWKGSGNDVQTQTLLKNACWEKDYFTSARPSPQKGTAVSLPLTGNAPVTGIAVGNANVYNTTAAGYIDSAGGNPPAGSDWSSNTVDAAGVNVKIQGDNTTKVPKIFANLAAVTAANVNDIRLALAVQRFKENMSRWGSSYKERLLAAFGVTNQDARLESPEYLGGGKQNLQFSEVLQTGTDFNANTGVGALKGHGIGAMKANGFRYRVPEYGYVITVMVVRPETQYFQGTHKMWFRQTKEDYFQPELQDLGQQPIQNREIYAAHSAPTGVFGYQDRYDEYRRIENSVSGDFRTTLNMWHMARDFSSDPALNSTFVQANPTTRVFAVTSSDQLLCYVDHNLRITRKLKKYAQPLTF